MVTLADVRAARERIAPHIQRTPLVSSRALGERIGASAYLKLECLQRTGSFKPRGFLNAVLALPEGELGRGIMTMSAGNGAQAIAYAGQVRGASVTVVMPQAAPRTKVEATRGYGAQVRFAAELADLLPAVRELEAQGLRYLHPHEDPAIFAGHGTVALEVLEDLPEADLLVVPVGGGGLISGVATAASAIRPGLRVIGVEPEGAPTMRSALDQGRPVPLQSARTMADALAAPIAGGPALEIVRRLVEDVVLVSETEIAEGVRFLASRARVIAEPGGAAGVAALLAGRIPVRSGERVVALVSGGNVDLSRLAEILGAHARSDATAIGSGTASGGSGMGG